MDNAKILVTGGESMMGEYLKREFNHGIIASNRHELDISDRNTSKEIITREKIGIVINTAGATNADRKTLFEVNAFHAVEFAKICRECGVTFIYLSTARVFDGGKKGLYLEKDPANPLDDYGLSKYVGERLIENELYNGQFYIFRMPMVLGLRKKHPEGQIITRLIRQAKTEGQIRVADDVFQSPVYAGDIAAALRRFLETGYPSGTYHLSCGESISLYSLAKYLLPLLKEKAEVIPAKSESFKTNSRVPRYQALGSEKLKLLRSWKNAVELFANDILAAEVA
jgi:dTDP-4-dehydrorhamnose reductase